MKKILVAALAVFCAVSHAQETRKIAFRTLCLEQLPGLEKVSVLAGGDPTKSQEVILYTDVSPVIEGVFANGEATFHTVADGPDGKPVATLVGKTKLAKSERQLFLFVPGGGEGKPAYQVQAYDDDTKSFGLGQIRAINLAPVPVRFVLSGAVTPQIPAGKFAQFPHSSKVDDYKMYPVAVEFLSANGEWVKGQSVSWKATDLRREVVITLVDAKYKQPTVQMFSDVPPWLPR